MSAALPVMSSPVNRQILRLALPSIVSNITVPLLGLCDVAIAGHLGDAAYIAAIAVGSMVFNTMYWMLGFLRMCTSGLTAQALGARRLDEATLRLVQGLALGFFLGCLMVVFQWPLRELSLCLMGPSVEVASLARTYFDICIWGAPAVLSLYALSGWPVGMQNTRLPMMTAICQNVANIAVSFLLVFGLGWRIEGVATGTVAAQWLGFFFALGETLREYGPQRLRRWLLAGTPFRGLLTFAIHLPKTDFSRFFAPSRDLFLRTLCLVAVNFYFTAQGASQGALVLAANTLLLQLFLLFSYVADGFAFAGEALSGRHWGAGNPAALRATIGWLFAWGGVLSLLFSTAYALAGTSLLGVLTDNADVIRLATSYLPWVVAVPFCSIAAFLFDGIFVGLTATRGMLWSSLLATLGFFAVWLLLRDPLGNHALWLAQLVYLAVRGAAQAAIYRHIACTHQ